MTSNTIVDQTEIALNDIKGIDIVSKAIYSKTFLCSHIIIVTSSSTRHADALCNSVLKVFKDLKQPKPLIHGYGESSWVLIDGDTIIVHIMSESARKYYSLEKLWY